MAVPAHAGLGVASSNVTEGVLRASNRPWQAGISEAKADGDDGGASVTSASDAQVQLALDGPVPGMGEEGIDATTHYTFNRGDNHPLSTTSPETIDVPLVTTWWVPCVAPNAFPDAQPCRGCVCVRVSVRVCVCVCACVSLGAAATPSSGDTASAWPWQARISTTSTPRVCQLSSRQSGRCILVRRAPSCSSLSCSEAVVVGERVHKVNSSAAV